TFAGLISGIASSQEHHNATKENILLNNFLGQILTKIPDVLDRGNGSQLTKDLYNRITKFRDQSLASTSPIGSNSSAKLKVVTEFELRCLSSNNTRCYIVNEYNESSTQVYVLMPDN